MINLDQFMLGWPQKTSNKENGVLQGYSLEGIIFDCWKS